MIYTLKSTQSILLWLVVTSLMFVPLSIQAAPVGNISQIQGDVSIQRDGKIIKAKREMLIQTGDQLITTDTSKIRFRLRDNTRITLANRTRFEIKRYQYDDKQETSDARFRLVEGAFRAVTGAIGLQKKPRFEVETAVATMGIRGTDFWGGFIFSEALDVTMLSGKGVYIQNGQGTVELTAPGQGTTVRAGQPPGQIKNWPDKKIQRAVQATALFDE